MQSTLGRINCRVDVAEGMISELENIAVRNSPKETPSDKIMF